MQRMTFLLVAMAVLGSGCETISGRQRRQSETRLYNEIVNMKASIQRLEQRVEGIEAGREDLYAQVANLQAEQDRTASKRGAELEALDSKLAAQKAAAERTRKEMLEKLSHKMADIMRTSTPTSATRTESGYEHVVKPGETLSEIAKAYGVKTGIITKANNLKNPDDLRVGQKLFIPE